VKNNWTPRVYFDDSNSELDCIVFSAEGNSTEFNCIKGLPAKQVWNNENGSA